MSPWLAKIGLARLSRLLARSVPNRAVRPSVAPLDVVCGLRDRMGWALQRMRELIPRAPVAETQAGHFLQEEVPLELSDAVVDVAGRG